MSTAIGIVLLVAIAVLLAATVGLIAFGYAEEKPKQAPTFATTHVYHHEPTQDGEFLEVAHESGDAIGAENVTLTITGAVVREVGTDARVADAKFAATDLIGSQAGSRLTAGETFRIDEGDFVRAVAGNPAVEAGTGPRNDHYVDLREAVVKLSWNPPQEGPTAIIFEWRGADA